MTIIVKLKPGEKVDKLIARFKRATQDERVELKEKQYFISKTEEKQQVLKRKKLKIKELERKLEKGIF